MKVSIIMPIYNAEKYLEKSLDSIVNQSYKNIELILINDGSTDESIKILEKYENDDRRVIVKNIKNSGPGVARNKGLEIATGDYISFVDADDWITLDAIDTLVSSTLIDDYDVVSSNHFRVEMSTQVSKNSYHTGVINKSGTDEEKKNYNSFKTSSSFGYVWGKVYKKSFIVENNIKFSEERKVFLEDALFNLKVFAYNPKYYVENVPLYYYNIIDDSISNTREDITGRAIKVLEDYEIFLDEKNCYNKNVDLFIPLATRTIAWSLFKTMDYNFSFKAIHKRVKEFSNNRTIIRLFENNLSLKRLKDLDSIIQFIFYSFIVLSIRYKLERIISLIFYMFYPLFKIYIKKIVKT